MPEKNVGKAYEFWFNDVPKHIQSLIALLYYEQKYSI